MFLDPGAVWGRGGRLEGRGSRSFVLLFIVSLTFTGHSTELSGTLKLSSNPKLVSSVPPMGLSSMRIMLLSQVREQIRVQWLP